MSQMKALFAEINAALEENPNASTSKLAKEFAKKHDIDRKIAKAFVRSAQKAKTLSQENFDTINALLDSTRAAVKPKIKLGTIRKMIKRNFKTLLSKLK